MSVDSIERALQLVRVIEQTANRSGDYELLDTSGSLLSLLQRDRLSEEDLERAEVLIDDVVARTSGALGSELSVTNALLEVSLRNAARKLAGITSGSTTMQRLPAVRLSGQVSSNLKLDIAGLTLDENVPLRDFLESVRVSARELLVDAIMLRDYLSGRRITHREAIRARQIVFEIAGRYPNVEGGELFGQLYGELTSLTNSSTAAVDMEDGVSIPQPRPPLALLLPESIKRILPQLIDGVEEAARNEVETAEFILELMSNPEVDLYQIPRLLESIASLRKSLSFISKGRQLVRIAAQIDERLKGLIREKFEGAREAYRLGEVEDEVLERLDYVVTYIEWGLADWTKFQKSISALKDRFVEDPEFASILEAAHALVASIRMPFTPSERFYSYYAPTFSSDQRVSLAKIVDHFRSILQDNPDDENVRVKVGVVLDVLSKERVTDGDALLVRTAWDDDELVEFVAGLAETHRALRPDVIERRGVVFQIPRNRFGQLLFSLQLYVIDNPSAAPILGEARDTIHEVFNIGEGGTVSDSDIDGLMAGIDDMQRIVLQNEVLESQGKQILVRDSDALLEYLRMINGEFLTYETPSDMWFGPALRETLMESLEQGVSDLPQSHSDLGRIVGGVLDAFRQNKAMSVTEFLEMKEMVDRARDECPRRAEQLLPALSVMADKMDRLDKTINRSGGDGFGGPGGGPGGPGSKGGSILKMQPVVEGLNVMVPADGFEFVFPAQYLGASRERFGSNISMLGMTTGCSSAGAAMAGLVYYLY